MKLVLTAFVLSALAPAQTFETASVKLMDPGPPYGGYRHQITPGGITMHKVSLGYCIRIAWGLKYAYDLAGPGWLDPPTDILVDITAKTSAPATPDEILLMLRNLLIDRFGLKAHTEARELRTYSLAQIRRDAALHPTAGGEPKMNPGSKPYSQAFKNMSMAQLARYLGPPVTSRPVIDKTGLDGAFDFELDLGPYILDPATGKQILDVRGGIDSEGAHMQALRDQLGLALKSDRASFPVLVIDHIEKTPTGN